MRAIASDALQPSGTGAGGNWHSEGRQTYQNFSLLDGVRVCQVRNAVREVEGRGVLEVFSDFAVGVVEKNQEWADGV